MEKNKKREGELSTLLATSNPEAVAEIDPNRDRRAPYQGQSLVYHCRPGEGRGGKITAVALCTRVEDDDHVELLIIYAADDFITKWKIPRKTDQNNVNCWSFNDYDEEHYQPGSAKLPVVTEQGQLTWEDVKEMYKEIGVLRAANVTLAEHVAELRAARPKPFKKHERVVE